MIYLITGQPGAGKTLYSLEFVEQEFQGREIYYDGIAELKLPWIEVEGGGRNWMDCPDKSVIVLDEAQRVFRVRGTGSTVPDYVAALETHRHRGIDLVLTTQHPKLIDSHVRRLVGRHTHVMRAVGTKNAVLHTWMEVNEDPDKSRADSTIKMWPYPKKYFDAYKSAELHTHKARVPARIWVMIGAPFAIVYLAWYAYTSMMGKGEKPAEPKPAVMTVSAKGSAQAAPVPAKQGPSYQERFREYLERHTPRVANMPHTAEAYEEVLKPQQAPEPAACVASSTRCTCFTQQATALPGIADALCREIVAHGYFRAWQAPASSSGPLPPAEQNGGRAAVLSPSSHAVPEPAPAGSPVGPLTQAPGAPQAVTGGRSPAKDMRAPSLPPTPPTTPAAGGTTGSATRASAARS